MKKTILVVAVVMFLPLSLNAAGNGSSPKGKPFIAINDQIVEVEGAVSSLQEQIDLLVARVDTVDERVVANANAISTLHEQNAVIETIIQQNLADIASIETEVAYLQQTNTELLGMIAGNIGDIAAMQSEIDANKAMIATLQSAILLVQDNVISLETGLQAQIDNNVTLIQALQEEIDLINEKLELKQNLVNGICPDGSAIKEILTDGSVICEGAGGTSGQLQSVYSYHYSGYMLPGARFSMRAFCPTDYIATGPGFAGASSFDIYTLVAGYNWGYIYASNKTSYKDYIYTYVTCTRIAP